jgi:CHAT domain
MPRLIFANACLSGGLSWLKATAPKGRKSRRGTPPDDAQRRTAAQADSRLVASLADEFFRRGVADDIGTAWEVPEEPAELFAVTFYETLLGNQSSPVPLGTAMLRARAALRTSQGDWRPELQSTWAAYQHYGDPTRSLWV